MKGAGRTWWRVGGAQLGVGTGRVRAAAALHPLELPSRPGPCCAMPCHATLSCAALTVGRGGVPLHLVGGGLLLVDEISIEDVELPEREGIKLYH